MTRKFSLLKPHNTPLMEILKDAKPAEDVPDYISNFDYRITRYGDWTLVGNSPEGGIWLNRKQEIITMGLN